MDPITCRFCGGTNCEHGDHCADCGCPRCGFQGQSTHGWCIDCDWEIRPGARKAWRAAQPVKTSHQIHREVMDWLGIELPPDDEVGGPIWGGDDGPA